MAKSREAKEGGFNPVTFLSDCREELHKVTKPTRQETMQATLVTLVIMFFLAGTLALLDVVFNRLMSVVL